MAGHFIDHSDEVRAQMEANKLRALTAMGIKAVNLVLGRMQSGYGKPIRQTGDLQRDVNFEVGRSGPDTLDIGNSLEYAPFVHEGTYKMRGRPYITDTINSKLNVLRDIAQQYLKEDFDK